MNESYSEIMKLINVNYMIGIDSISDRIKNIVACEEDDLPIEIHILNKHKVITSEHFIEQKDLYNFHNIIMHICVEKKILHINFIKAILLNEYIDPIILLLTKDNFIKVMDFILKSISTNIYEKIVQYYRAITRSGPYEHKQIQKICERYVTLLYLGFKLYPETKTPKISNSLYNLILLYDTLNNFYNESTKFDRCFKPYTLKYNTDLETLKTLVLNVDPSLHTLKIFEDTVYNLKKQENIFLHIFKDIEMANLVDTLEFSNYKSLVLLLNNGFVPTNKNFDTLINNDMIKTISNDKKFTNDDTNTVVINSILDNISEISKMFLNYKILPTEIFVSCLQDILKIVNTKFSNRIIIMNEHTRNTYNIICSIAQDLVDYDYPLTDKICSILILKKDSIFKKYTINEEFYYNLYKIYDLAMEIVPIENFNLPVHIMRYTCLSKKNKKAILNNFKTYIKKHNLKPDRYCFEFATFFNKDIAEWLFSKNCLPTIKSASSYNMKKTNRFIDNKYLVKLVDTVQTQEYMCEQYNDFVVEQ